MATPAHVLFFHTSAQNQSTSVLDKNIAHTVDKQVKNRHFTGRGLAFGVSRQFEIIQTVPEC
jgi:hypothetical protein